ncbi:MAG: Nif3-like dinuclear metal center hexameric protein [Candidatus Bruticola sp.]
MVKTSELVRYLSDLLRIKEFTDFTSNGIQVEGADEINKVGFAVDACCSTFEALQDCQLICVHHGMMWPSWNKVEGVNKRRLKFLLDRNIGLFVAHLPLDRHPQLGNNAQILKALGWEKTGEFGEVGWLCDLEEPISIEEAQKKLAALFPRQLASYWKGPDKIKRIGVCSGGGGGEYLYKGISHHLDLYITGETSYSMTHDSEEYGLNIACVGHYDSETFGVQALQAEVEAQFGLETAFFDNPTGL